MANQEQLELVRSGPETWNTWRDSNQDALIDLRGGELAGLAAIGVNLAHADLRDANLSKADLRGANFAHANLGGARFSGANLASATLADALLLSANFENAILQGADFSRTQLLGVKLDGAKLKGATFTEVGFWRATLFQYDLEGATFDRAHLYKTMLAGSNLRGAHFIGADLKEANLIAADLTGAHLIGADLTSATLAEATLERADFSNAIMFEANLTDAGAEHANFENANLRGATLVRTKLNYANLTGCKVYGLSAWDVQLVDATQDDLVITPPETATVTVSNLEVAQFIYLLLRSDSLTHVVDTITSRLVLILGRFTPERKRILDELRKCLRFRGYSPVLFDFEKPSSRDLTETIRILAGLSRFVIADITDARSIPQELMAIVPGLPSVPVQPVLARSDSEYAMFEHLRRYPWVLPIVHYESQELLIANLEELVIQPAERWLAQASVADGVSKY